MGRPPSHPCRECGLLQPQLLFQALCSAQGAALKIFTLPQIAARPQKPCCRYGPAADTAQLMPAHCSPVLLQVKLRILNRTERKKNTGFGCGADLLFAGSAVKELLTSLTPSGALAQGLSLSSARHGAQGYKRLLSAQLPCWASPDVGEKQLLGTELTQDARLCCSALHLPGRPPFIRADGAVKSCQHAANPCPAGGERGTFWR